MTRNDPGSYEATLRELYARASRGVRPGLDRMRAALEALGHPERACEVVHVAGTNGKGSVSRMVAAGLPRRTGLFTSPHLHALTERFVVDGEPLPRGALVQAWRAIRDPIAAVELTFFETVTLLAFELFRRAECSRAVLEVGLGGRLDSTNVIERPRICAITRVGLDHATFLGDDLASVAREKAGILKPGVPCVVAPQAPPVDEVIDRVAAEVGAPLLRPSLVVDPFEVTLGERRWSGGGPRLAGAHQRENAAVALAALWQLGADDAAITRALDASWPGRLETIGDVLLDAAHNLDGALALAAHLEGEPRRTLVFGAMRDKAHREMLEALRLHVGRVVLTRASLERAEDPESLGLAGDLRARDVEAALSRARSLGAPIVVAGSIFVVAEARAALLGLQGDPPIAM